MEAPTMASNNFRESLKSQFRGAFGEQRRHLDAQPETDAAMPVLEEAKGQEGRAVPSGPVVEPDTGTDSEKTLPADKAVAKRTVEHRCGIEDFLKASPEEQLCYSLGEQMTAILRHLLSMPKPWINLTNANIINESGMPVPTESVRTMFRILQEKGFILERRRADIGTYRGVAYVLDTKLAKIFCTLHNISVPEWLSDQGTLGAGQSKATQRKSGRPRKSDAKYEELARQNEELRKQVDMLREQLAKLTENNAG